MPFPRHRWVWIPMRFTCLAGFPCSEGRGVDVLWLGSRWWAPGCACVLGQGAGLFLSVVHRRVEEKKKTASHHTFKGIGLRTPRGGLVTNIHHGHHRPQLIQHTQHPARPTAHVRGLQKRRSQGCVRAVRVCVRFAVVHVARAWHVCIVVSR